MNKVLVIAVAIIVTFVVVNMGIADRAPVQSFQAQLEHSCVNHGLAASCSLQEAYIAQLDCRDAGLPATCSIWELSHKR